MRKEIVVKEENVKPLSVLEQKRLDQLEEVVVINFRSFVQVGQALAEIRDRQLYRAQSKTFELYVKAVFDIARGTAYRYIAAAQVVENVSTWRQKNGDSDVIDLLPINEAQVRPLTRLRPEQQVSVWQAAVEQAPRGKITAGYVNRVVKKYLGEVTTTGIRNTQARLQHEHVSADFKATFDAFLDQVVKEKEAGYKTTPKAMILKYVDSLRAILADGDANQEAEDMSVSADDDGALARGCYDCQYKKGMINPAKGVKIPGYSGKCIRPQGLCGPEQIGAEE